MDDHDAKPKMGFTDLPEALQTASHTAFTNLALVNHVLLLT